MHENGRGDKEGGVAFDHRCSALIIKWGAQGMDIPACGA